MSLFIFILKTTNTTYSVEDLEANTGYKFRVMVLAVNQSSSFSDWSAIFNTTSESTVC